MVKGEMNSVDNYIKDYGKDEASTIPILQAIQNDYGYLPEPMMLELCEKTNIKKNRLYGVATFYSQFKLKPKGKNIIKICTGTACHVKGAGKLLSVIQDVLAIGIDETTEDGMFSLESVACLGCCSLAPVMMINDKVFGKLTSMEVKRIIKTYV